MVHPAETHYNTNLNRVDSYFIKGFKVFSLKYKVMDNFQSLNLINKLLPKSSVTRDFCWSSSL